MLFGLVLSCHVLSCHVLSCLVLSCLVFSCFFLSCLVLSCLVLSYLVLSYLVLSCLVLSCLVLSCRGLSCLALRLSRGLTCLVWLIVSSAVSLVSIAAIGCLFLRWRRYKKQGETRHRSFVRLCEKFEFSHSRI